uniref:AB hydrolase-1 domain-containing protein n=1 Tax=Hanusia phi TaxID=3032 RepID=A0A7S0NDJ7_9CRYP
MCYAADQPAKVAGLCVIGCAGQYGVIGPTRFYLPFLKLKSIARLVGEWMAKQLRDPELLRKQLENMYVDKGAISNNLVTGLSCIWRDDETFARGKEVFSSIVKADPGRKWKDLVSEAEVGYCGPLLAVWGRKDQINPPETLIDLKECRPDLELKWLDGGHCVHDEKPREFNELLVEWATRVQQENRSFPIPRAPRYKVLELWPF